MQRSVKKPYSKKMEGSKKESYSETMDNFCNFFKTKTRDYTSSERQEAKLTLLHFVARHIKLVSPHQAPDWISEELATGDFDAIPAEAICATIQNIIKAHPNLYQGVQRDDVIIPPIVKQYIDTLSLLPQPVIRQIAAGSNNSNMKQVSKTVYEALGSGPYGDNVRLGGFNKKEVVENLLTFVNISVASSLLHTSETHVLLLPDGGSYQYDPSMPVIRFIPQPLDLTLRILEYNTTRVIDTMDRDRFVKKPIQTKSKDHKGTIVVETTFSNINDLQLFFVEILGKILTKDNYTTLRLEISLDDPDFKPVEDLGRFFPSTSPVFDSKTLRENIASFTDLYENVNGVPFLQDTIEPVLKKKASRNKKTVPLLEEMERLRTEPLRVLNLSLQISKILGEETVVFKHMIFIYHKDLLKVLLDPAMKDRADKIMLFVKQMNQ